MTTLLLRLAGPLQSWGGQSKFDRRTTLRAPTKSGVVGLVASALGRRRNASVDDLMALRFGVRLDRPGVLLRDYHTAKSARSAYVTHRFYLSDAAFLAGLEGDPALLAQIQEALARPAFPLFLGRRACPPEGRVCLGLRPVNLEEALRSEAPVATRGAAQSPRVMVETRDAAGPGYFLRDEPLSFNQEHRRFGFRRVIEYSVPLPTQGTTQHDPMGELEGW